MTLKELRDIVNNRLAHVDEDLEVLVYYAYDDYISLSTPQLAKVKKTRDVNGRDIFERATEGEGEDKLLLEG